MWTGGFDGPQNGEWAWAGTTLPWNYQYWDGGYPFLLVKTVLIANRTLISGS